MQERAARWLADVTPRLTADDRPTSVARLMHELNRVMPAGVGAGDRRRIRLALGRAAVRLQSVAGRGFVADRGFASIGYGLPGGIGARLGTPDAAPVVALTGDGGLNMTLESSRPPCGWAGR